MAKLTKRDIVVSISNQTGMVQHQVFDVVQKTLDKITDSLANNIPVELRNFGVFLPRLTRPRIGRNPNQPGSSFVIPPRATVKFKAGKIMRQRVEKLSRQLKEAEEQKIKPPSAHTLANNLNLIGRLRLRPGFAGPDCLSSGVRRASSGSFSPSAQN
jgi:nucleoid DNA-binding protein